jgi:CRP/FNR family cyclic AMP-dependent transcriptional regulator
VHIAAVPREAFLRHLSEDRLSMDFVANRVERNLEYEADLCGHLFDTSERRLRRLLLKLCPLGVTTGGAVELPVRLTHDMMAQMVGTTRSRVTFFMNKFRRQGWVEYGRSLLIYPGRIPDVH